MRFAPEREGNPPAHHLFLCERGRGSVSPIPAFKSFGSTELILRLVVAKHPESALLLFPKKFENRPVGDASLLYLSLSNEISNILELWRCQVLVYEEVAKLVQ
jgi:hypothetical protein